MLKPTRYAHNSGPVKRIDALSKNLKVYAGDVEKYINDYLPIKSPLLDVQKLLKVNLMNVSPVPDRLVIGKDGWLFLGKNYGDIIKESKGIKTLDDEAIGRMVDNAIRSDQTLRKAGMDYYLCVAPNKHTVYGEYLPIHKVGPTILEKFMSQIGNRINFTDLKSEYDLSGEHRLFEKTNTHFNGLGSFLAVQALLRKMREKHPDIALLRLEDYEMVHSKPMTDELTRMLRSTEPVDRLSLFTKSDKTPLIQAAKLPVPSRYPAPMNYEKRYVNPGKPYKVLICGDSFMGQMFPFLKEQFGEVTFINENRLNLEAIELDKPDIVIQEIVERSFDLIMMNQ